ncbi:hypothetical protein [Acidaminococcus sp.]|jgi:Ni/Co efflux regulator RcnB|uniref:hypothetical protein n=1 Tax=Acidaminococcus sp. TaxID=1872103 RepID=UPI0026DD7044|nr:hypothetical protein [uncultured Acidaminococcus sp.]
MTKIVTYAMAKPYETMKNRFKKITSVFLLGVTLVLGASAMASSKAEAATPPTPREVHQVRLERHKKAVQHRKEVREKQAEARKKHAEIRKEHRQEMHRENKW